MDILSDVSVSGKLTAETLKVNDEIETKIIKATNSDGLYGNSSLQVTGNSIFNGNAEFCGELLDGWNLKTIELGRLYNSGYTPNKTAFEFRYDENNNTTVSITATEFHIDTPGLLINGNNVVTKYSKSIYVPENCSWFLLDTVSRTVYFSGYEYNGITEFLPSISVFMNVEKNGKLFKKNVEADFYFCEDQYNGQTSYYDTPYLLCSYFCVYAEITPRDEPIYLHFNFLV